MQKRFWSCVCALWLLGLASWAHAASEVRGVRLWRAPDNTRLVFDLSGPVQHNVFTLSAPNRVVIDIDGAHMATALNDVANARTPIRSLRAGNRGAEQIRIVLEMNSDVTPKSFLLAPNQTYGHRLVLDLFDQANGGSVATSAPVASPVPASSTPKSAPAESTALPPASQFRITKISPSGAASSPVSQPVAPPPVQTTPVNTAKASAAHRTQGRRDVVIALDAGHGGEDPGAIGPNGLQEKGVVLEIARKVQHLINQEKGFRAELVRTGDYFIPLRKRTEIARSKGADLFVSIHADAAPRSSAFGASVYALSDKGATSEAARWLADSENNSDKIGGVGGVSLEDKDPMLAGVLLDLSMTATLSSSLDVGARVLGNVGRIAPLHKSRVEQAGFMVLKSPDIPSILVETGFISNPQESVKLNTAAHQQALARSIQAGVHQFFRENPPPGTYLAWQREQGRRVGAVPAADSTTLAQAENP